MSDTVTYKGKQFVKSEEGHRGKKAHQVAVMVDLLQNNPGIPYDFEKLCEEAGAKYPQDVQAAMMALEMTEQIDIYKQTGGGKKIFYMWVGSENPTLASDE